MTSFRLLRLLFVAIATTTVSACSLHLHSPENAKRARAAFDTFEKLKIDAVVTTSRTNMTELSKAQLETRQRVSETLMKVDLSSVIGAEPDDPGAGPPPVVGPGWRELIDETAGVLNRYGLLGPDGTYTKEGVEASRAIRNRASNKLQLSNNRQTYRALVEDYKAANPAKGTLDTQCPTVLARVPDEKTFPPAPPDEPPRKWEHYTRFIAPMCRTLARQERVLKDADEALRKDSEYQRIAAEVTQLEGELTKTESTAKDLLEKYEAAKKRLAEAQRESAKATVAEQTAAAKAQLDAARAKVDAAVKTIEGVVDTSKTASELLQVQIKTGVLETLLSQAKALSGDPAATTAAPAQQLLAAIKKYPDIAGRLKAADVPPVNVLLLELAIQRLQYRRLQVVRDAKKDILTILKLQAEAHADGAAAWIRVMDNVILARDAKVDQKTPMFAAFTSATPVGKQRVAEVLVASAFAKQSSEYRLNALNARLRDRYRSISLDMTEIAVGTWNDLIRAPLAEIVAYHEGGITTEEIARLINALGVMAIAVGVYQ